jgi:hypothetical protein
VNFTVLAIAPSPVVAAAVADSGSTTIEVYEVLWTESPTPRTN